MKILVSKDFVHKCNASLHVTHCWCSKAYHKTHCCSWCKSWLAVLSPLERYMYSWRVLYRSCNSCKIILTVNFKYAWSPHLFLKCRQSVFPLVTGFACGVILVFCCCLCTCLWSLCWRRYPGGGGYFRNFWVGMCRWDPGTLNLYQS